MNFKKIIALTLTVCLLAIVLAIPAFAVGIERDGSDCAFFGDILVPFTHDDLPFSVVDFPYFIIIPFPYTDGAFSNQIICVYSASPLVQTDDGFFFTDDVYGLTYPFDTGEFISLNYFKGPYSSIYYYSGLLDGINSTYRSIDADTVLFCDYDNNDNLVIVDGYGYSVQSPYVEVDNASCYAIDFLSASFSYISNDNGWLIISNDLGVPVVIANESEDYIASAWVPEMNVSVTSVLYDVNDVSVLESINQFVSSAITWIGSFVSSVVSNPIILIFCICSFCGLGIGLFSRLKR